MTNDAIEVELFADVWCPFAYVGMRRFVARRAELGVRVTIRHRAWPLELVNGEPLDAQFVAEEVDALRERVAPNLFQGFDPSAFPKSTLPALALVDAAYRVGVEAGEEMALAVRAALFEEGRDIARPEVLRAIGAAGGITAGPDNDQHVRDDLADGRRRGVVGSPYFFVHGVGEFCPALRIERVDGELHVHDNRVAVEGFLATVLQVE